MLKNMKKPSFVDSVAGSAVKLNNVKEEMVEEDDEEVSDDGGHFEFA
jgi:hypothetical protein